MAQGNRRSAAGGGSSEPVFEEGSQTADTAYPLFGLSRRCIPSWVSRAHSSLPSQRIYLFVDNLSTPRPETPVWGCISYMILRALSQFRLNRLAAHIPASPKPPLGSSGAGGSDGITIPPVGSSGRFRRPRSRRWDRRPTGCSWDHWDHQRHRRGDPGPPASCRHGPDSR